MAQTVTNVDHAMMRIAMLDKLTRIAEYIGTVTNADNGNDQFDAHAIVCEAYQAVDRDPQMAGKQMDGNVLKTRCRSCGAYLVKGKCPVSRKDCGR